MMVIQLILSSLTSLKPLTQVKMKPYVLGDVVVRTIETYFTERVSGVHVGGELLGPFQCIVVFRKGHV